MTGDALKEGWLKRALARAGIDRARWHPSVGVEDNRRTIEDVYGYYGQLFLDHPYLLWAGMASMIGPAFYAGFMDIGILPDAARRAVRTVFGGGSSGLGREAAGDLGFYETTFLTMQKKIFEDQATMHEAYLAGGLPEIKKFFDARIIDGATVVAWQQIDAGHRDKDQRLLDSGNRTLLWREQRDIIDRFYVEMLRHRQGHLFTYLMTVSGAPSVPGAHAYADVYPLKLTGRLPPAVISLGTPFADGNIAVFADRWSLIETDTLPHYLKFVRDHRSDARTLVETPVAKRAARYRILVRWSKLATAAVERWRLQVSIGKNAQQLVDAQRPALPPMLQEDSNVIDLTHPATRESMGYGKGSSSRVWMRADRKPFDLTVALPNGRAYRAQAAMAAALSSTIGGEPDRLTVQLPSADLEAIERLLVQYASEWGFPRNAVTAWRNEAEQRAADRHQYGTHVFTAKEVGFAHLEFEVSHHVQERLFIPSALFSW